ncbi:hypothetical protein GQ54DRAFT_276194, partial [Martensiomyces pterosporus]
MQGILALAVCILHFTGPFFLQRILRSIEVFGSGTHPSSSEKSIRSAYLDAFGLLFFTIFASILSNQTLWIGRHIGMRLKGLLVAELSTKTLRRRGKGSWEDEKKDEDEKDEDDEDSTPTASAAADGKIMNLLTADFQRVTEVSAYLDNVYSLPLTLFIGIWYMYALLGISALVGLSLAIVYVPLSKVLFAYLTKVEEKLNALSDERVTVITELLQGIKAVKLFGWESRFLEKVDEKREKQLSYMWRLLVAWVRVMVASSLAPMLVLLVIFAVYVIAFGNKLTAEIAFTSISVFQLIRLVFEHMPGFLNWAIGGYVSLGRIDSYLGQPQVQDLEERVATASEGSDSSDGALGFVDADLEWEIAGTEDDAAKPASTASSTSEEPTKVGTPDTELQNDSQATEATPLLPSSSQVKAPLSANASYTSLSKQADMVAFSLKNINVRFPFGGLSIVAGPTGSGKSSLLSALIGEMSLVRGKILLPTINPALSYVVMMREGEVTLKGNPQELQELGVFSKVLAELESTDKKDADKKEKAKGKGKGKNEATADSPASGDEDQSKSVNDTKTEDEYNLERLRKMAEQKGLDPNADLSVLEGTLVEDEERETGYVKPEVWLTFTSACGSKWFWIGSLIMLIGSQVAVVLQDYWIRIWDDAKHHSAVYWLSIYVLIGLLGIVWRMVQSIIMYAGAIKASRTLHSRLLRSVVRATPRFFDSTPLGRIINRFSRDMQTIDEWTMDTIGWWIADILAVLSVFAIITAVTPAFIFVACFVALLYAGMAYYYLTASRELKRLESNTMSPLLSLFGELILGVSSIRAFGVKKYYVKEAINRIGAHNRPFYMVWATNRWLSVRIDFAGAAVSFACAMFILFSLGWLDAGLAGFTLSYALTFSERMLWVIRNYSTNELNMNAVERVGQYLKVEQEAPLESTPENKPPPAWPQTGNIEIESLVIEYVPGVPVLHDLSLSVKHGEKIGVVGRTGAGKSTLSLAFLRFIEAAKGRITLDNVDISKIGLEDLRRNVTIIPQDPVLFNGTIRFNLDPF